MGKGRYHTVGIAIVRSETAGIFGDVEVNRLNTLSKLLLSVVNKHVDVVTQAVEPYDAVGSLGEIEACLVAMTDLSRREFQVCARLIFGWSAAAIAADLCIGLESGKTYRKRSYKRLGVSSERELLLLYLKHWNAWRALQAQCFIH